MNPVFKKAKWLLAAAIFAICIAPTFISYRPYRFGWDDAVYLWQSIAVDRAFWAGSTHGAAWFREIRSAMAGVRPPAMTLLGLPWGILRGWDAAGKCFVTLESEIAFVAAFCFFLLARIGARPLLLVLASICVGVSLGPWPPGSSANYFATGLMADSLFAWTVLASLLLIPYEARTSSGSWWHGTLRGAMWGLVLSLGTMTKISFLYFVALILPILLFTRYRRGGFRSFLAAFSGFFLTALPAAAYLIRYGRSSFENGGASSYGALAGLYKTSLIVYLEQNIHNSPGVWAFVLSSVGGVVWLAIKRGPFTTKLDLLPLLIAGGFALIALGSANRQFRYVFPVIVSVPFLFVVILSRNEKPVPIRFGILLAGPLVLVMIAAALPTRFRAERKDSLARADAVLAQAVRCGDSSILMATDSVTLNSDLVFIGIEVSNRTDSVHVHGLIWNASLGLPLSEDMRTMQGSDLVVFQDDRALNPPFTNIRVPRYRSYISQQPNFSPIKVWDDVWVFSKHCK